MSNQKIYLRLNVYDVLGKLVASLVDKYHYEGVYEIEWDAVNQPSGVYFYILESNISKLSKKMLLVK